MRSYILNEPCGICASDTTVCPFRYKCNHIFCLTCIYPNRKNVVLRKCPICRKPDMTMGLISSPIYYLKYNDVFEQFYSDFFRKSMNKINNFTEILTEKIGKFVVLDIFIHDKLKNNSQNVSYLGTLQFINKMSVTLSNCYHLNKDMRQLYPTTPEIKSFILKSDFIVYVENDI